MSVPSKNITVIPAKISRNAQGSAGDRAKKRVAGYARVSTDTEEQLNSYEAQVDFYTRHIKSNPEWEFAGVYTDEGITATSTKNRDGFNTLIRDALDGKIDLILTKSVSRFARNTVDTISAVRKLKEKGIEIFFEKENIYTLDSKSELVLTIMASIAQEESRSISENVTWGQRKRMADGKVTLPYGRFLGYERGEDGLPKIVEAEAETVRLIYRMFLKENTYNAIARHLTAEGIPTPSGLTKWSPTTVRSILRNEKYKGDALLQKKYTVDFLTKKQKANEGEVPQYYVPDSHPAIIEPETFDLVQAEIKKRLKAGRRPRGDSPFSLRVICGECGEFYGPQIWHSKSDRHRKKVWQCNGKYGNHTYCRTPHLTEDALRQAFVTAFNKVLGSKDRYIAEYLTIIETLTSTEDLDREAAALQEECTVVKEMLERCVSENACVAQDQAEYRQRYDSLIERHNAAQTRLDGLQSEKTARSAKRERIRRFLDTLRESGGLLAEFDESLWHATVETMTVSAKDNILVTFRDGSKIKV